MNKKEERKLLLEQLKKTPVIQIAVEKIGISRATFYRWKSQDKKFGEEAEKALKEGQLLVNDMAESQLMNAIKNGNLTGIIFWLKSHHKDYSNKLEISGNITTHNELTPEQEKDIKRALMLANIKETTNGKNK